MTNSNPEKRHGTMFCGFGGSCSGAKQAGLDCAFAIDNNDRHKVAMKKAKDGDLSWMDGKEGEDWQWEDRLPAIETREKNLKDGKGMVMSVLDFKPTAKHAARFVTASPPCKRFSTSAETWDEDDDYHSELDKDIKELGFVAIEKALAVPGMEYYVMENVTGLLNKKNISYLLKMVKMLRDEGFEVEWNIFNAHDLGCCQLRERLIMIASKSGRKNLLPAAPDGISKKKFKDIMEKGDTKDSKERMRKAEWAQSTYLTFVAKELRGAARMKIVIPDADEAVKMGWEADAVRSFKHIDVLPTIACNAGGGPTRKKWMVLPFNGSGYRNATLLEALRAQDFDDEWLDNLPRNTAQAWSMVGNAVPRALMHHIMHHLIETDRFHNGDRKAPPPSCKSLPDSYVMKMSKRNLEIYSEKVGMATFFV